MEDLKEIKRLLQSKYPKGVEIRDVKKAEDGKIYYIEYWDRKLMKEDKNFPFVVFDYEVMKDGN